MKKAFLAAALVLIFTVGCTDRDGAARPVPVQVQREALFRVRHPD